MLTGLCGVLGGMKVCDLGSNYVLRVLPVSDVIWMCVYDLRNIDRPEMKER